MAESLAYASRIPVLHEAAATVLRNHLPLVLDAIARDLETPQTRVQSIEKSRGAGPHSPTLTAAQDHGLQRARVGLNIEQLVAEFRVLRSCVLRLWADAHPPDRHVIEDTMRFNEAVDQAVAESIAAHVAESDRWRNIFLGVLGHDLRGPLNAMLLTAQLQAREARANDGAGSERAEALVRNARRLAALLDSLLEYNKSALGVGMQLHRETVDLGAQCEEEIDILRRAFPHRRILFHVNGDTQGLFDGSRVREALANLVSNAAQHSPAGTDVLIAVTGAARAVDIVTENVADPIPPEVLNSLFEPLHQRPHAERKSDGNLGLGLFIVREVARAHGGEVTAVSAEGCIRFRMVLPKASD